MTQARLVIFLSGIYFPGIDFKTFLEELKSKGRKGEGGKKREKAKRWDMADKKGKWEDHVVNILEFFSN